MLTEANDLQSKNNWSGISVIALLRVAEASFSHDINALFPMLVTELGMTIEVRLAQKPNASSSRLVTPLAIVTVFSDGQL